MTEHTEEPRWHTEPYDPERDEAPEGAPEDCNGEHPELDRG